MIPHTNPPPPKPMKQITMPSRSPPSTPHSNVNHPHLVYYGPLSNSPEQSIVTIPDSPNHQDKNVQTSTKQIIVQNVSIQTLPNPPFTLQQKEPPNLPTLLQLGDLLWDPKLFTPMITHCNVHSPILNLYKSFRQTMNLETYQEIETIKIPIQSSIIHALYQLDALPFLIALKEALTKHGRKTFCIQCYHLGHFWKDCPFYRCLYCCLIWPKHDKTYASTIQNILDQPLSNRNPHHPLPSKSYYPEPSKNRASPQINRAAILPPHPMESVKEDERERNLSGRNSETMSTKAWPGNSRRWIGSTTRSLKNSPSPSITKNSKTTLLTTTLMENPAILKTFDFQMEFQI